MENLKPFTLSRLPKIIFGEGTYSRLPVIINSCGRRVLIITGGASLKRSGRTDELTSQLKQAHVQYFIESVQGEPTVLSIDELAGKYRHSLVDVVAAIGGGSVLDCGKAVAAMLAEEGSVRNYLENIGQRKPSGSKIPFIAVPTTAGTGSEATNNAVVCDLKEGYKKSLRHDAYMPDVAVIDPQLTMSAPQSLTLACGLDAAAQLIESYTSVKANVFTDALALQALSLLAESLPPLCREQSGNITLRANMSYAALVSGITLSQAGLGAVHGLAGPLGGLFPVPHGAVCGKLLFPVMTFVIKKIADEKNFSAQKRFADIGKILAGESGNDDAFYCRRFLDILHSWTQTMKLPPLSSFGMTSVHMEKALASADNKNSPVRLSRQEMKIILETVR